MDSLTSASSSQKEALLRRYGQTGLPPMGPWNEVIAAMLDHRSVRGYKPDPVPAGTGRRGAGRGGGRDGRGRIALGVSIRREDGPEDRRRDEGDDEREAPAGPDRPHMLSSRPRTASSHSCGQVVGNVLSEIDSPLTGLEVPHAHHQHRKHQR